MTSSCTALAVWVKSVAVARARTRPMTLSFFAPLSCLKPVYKGLEAVLLCADCGLYSNEHATPTRHRTGGVFEQAFWVPGHWSGCSTLSPGPQSSCSDPGD